jgi:hypothetical protein
MAPWQASQLLAITSRTVRSLPSPKRSTFGDGRCCDPLLTADPGLRIDPVSATRNPLGLLTPRGTSVVGATRMNTKRAQVGSPAICISFLRKCCSRCQRVLWYSVVSVSNTAEQTRSKELDCRMAAMSDRTHRLTRSSDSSERAAFIDLVPDSRAHTRAPWAPGSISRIPSPRRAPTARP